MSMHEAFRKHDVRKVVIAQLELLRLRPEHPPTQEDGTSNPHYTALCELFCEDLSAFTKEQLERGMAEFRKTWKYGGWPKIGQLMEYMSRERKLDWDRQALAAPQERPEAQQEVRDEAYWARYREETRRRFTEPADAWDRAHGVEPPGKPWIQMSLSERRDYEQRRDVALAKYCPWSVSRKRTSPARERQRAANIEKAEKTREALGGAGTGGEQ